MTKIVKHAAKKAKAHTRYYNANRKRLPGVTTITGIMNKPALVGWANRIGLQGIEVSKYVDELADIGTLAHAMIVAHLEGTELDTSDATPNQIDMAETATLKFWDWQAEAGFKPDFCERQLVSEKYQYGGTCDLYGTLTKRNNVKALVDLKTCSAIYNDHFTQLAGYDIALRENGYDSKLQMIVRVGRSDTEGFEAKECPRIDLHRKRFLLCRKLYDLNNQIRKAD